MSVHKCDQIPFCRNGKVYNPLNNKCECPYGLVFNNSRCVEPNCEDNEYWNGYRCIMINCPPGSYYRNYKCVHEPTPQDQCGAQYYWNGKTCNYHQYHCPYGTNWDGSLCKPTGSCKQGYYQNKGGHCVALPQACLPPTIWNGEKC